MTHACLLWYSSCRNFVTVDEPGYLAAGISHWDTGTFSMYRVNPPLPRMVSAFPVVLFTNIQRDYRNFKDEPGYRSEWMVGYDFVSANARDYFLFLRVARLANIFWSVLGALIVFRWASELYGSKAGYAALAIWSFEPNIIAHGQLMTQDLPAAVSGIGSTYLFWRYLQSPSWDMSYFVGLALGVALLTKFTLLVLLPVFTLLLLVHRFGHGHRTPVSRPTQVGQAVVILVVSFWVINIGYGFNGTCRPLGDYQFVSRPLVKEGGIVPGNRFRNSLIGAIPIPLPGDFVRGIDEQRRDFEMNWQSYLCGEWRAHGWWYYYLYALTVKTPLGFSFIFLASLMLFVFRHDSAALLRDELTLLLPIVAVLALVSSQTGFNSHMRYVLPAIPFGIVSSSKVACVFHRGQWKWQLITSGLLLWGITSSLLAYPHSLSYFNEAAGGPENGHEHLIDSNIDWGQDLIFFREWLEDHPEAAPLGFAYFGRYDPRHLDIEYTLPPQGLTPADWATSPKLGPQPGHYAVSVNFMRGVSFPAQDGQGRMHLIPPREYEYFLRFQPIAKAGYSIYIYRITSEQANEARQQLGLPPILEEAMHR